MRAQHFLAEEETSHRFVRHSRDALATVERRGTGDSLLEVLLRITQLQNVTLAGVGSRLEQLEQFSDQTLHRSVDWTHRRPHTPLSFRGTCPALCSNVLSRDLTCRSEGQLAMVPLRSHGDGHLHLLQQGGVDLRHPSPHHARVVDLICVFVSGQEAVGERHEQKLTKKTHHTFREKHQ